MYWATVVCSSLALLFMLANVSLINGNQKLQAELNNRQLVVNTASRVLPLNQQLSQALYQASVNKKDGEKIRELLTSQGFVLPKADTAATVPAAKQAKPAKKTPASEE